MTTSPKYSLPILNLSEAELDPLAALQSRERTMRNRKPLPMTMAEVRERGWDELDVVFVTGDA